MELGMEFEDGGAAGTGGGGVVSDVPVDAMGGGPGIAGLETFIVRQFQVSSYKI